MFLVNLGLATLAAFGALFAAGVAAAPAQASTPIPWCGTDSGAADRVPDATPGFSVHVAYVRAPGTTDRFAELAPRIVGDVTAFDAWWRGQDPTRMPRFDLFPAPGCASAFGSLDLTNLQVPQGIGGIDGAFQLLREQLATSGLDEPEKVYLVYYDGPTGQSGNERVCGQGARPRNASVPGLAIVYLDSCGADSDDLLRPVVAVHELLHVFGAVSSAAPSACQGGHVCDFPLDLMTAIVTGEELETHVLDFGRNDYYGHTGSWTDVQDSVFLERLDSPDRLPPSAITGLTVRTDRVGQTFVEWRPATDASEILYRVKLNGSLVDDDLTGTTAEAAHAGRSVVTYSVQAADVLGHLGPPSSVRFAPGRGIVDESGRLLRDTVTPSAVKRVRIQKARPTVRLSWTAASDGVGLRGYRVQLGKRTISVLRPAIVISRSRLATDVRITAVDRAGNLGPTTSVPLSRLR
ncbi:MAG: hypothetical protein ACXWZB_03060 [Gaiellaceae bacterium]